MKPSKIRLTRRCYTLPEGTRNVGAGIYDASDFSTEELDFLDYLQALSILEFEPALEAESKVERIKQLITDRVEEKRPIETRHRKRQKTKETKIK